MKLRCVKVEAIGSVQVSSPYSELIEWRSTLQCDKPFATVTIVSEHPEYEPNQLYEVSIRKANEQ